MSLVSNNTFGILSSAPDASIVEYIYAYVLDVIGDFTGTSSENENSITNRLCKALEYKKPPEASFFFHHQNIENDKENTSTDFAAFGTFSYAQSFGNENLEEPPPLVKFEAKRLSSLLPKKRSREYVIGKYEGEQRTENSGGIERFKNERHGADVTNACLIGYVQTDSFDFWKASINEWIQDEINAAHDVTLTWDASEQLSDQVVNSSITHFKSNCLRRSGDILNLRHIWIDFIGQQDAHQIN